MLCYAKNVKKKYRTYPCSAISAEENRPLQRQSTAKEHTVPERSAGIPAIKIRLLLQLRQVAAGTNRVIPIPPNIPEIKDFFRQWIAESDTQKIIPVSETEFRNEWFYPAVNELGLMECEIKNSQWTFAEKRHLTPHSTRHTFASLSASAGMRPENLQKIIGHADYSTTADIYIHKDISELISEMSKLKK